MKLEQISMSALQDGIPVGEPEVFFESHVKDITNLELRAKKVYPEPNAFVLGDTAQIGIHKLVAVQFYWSPRF